MCQCSYLDTKRLHRIKIGHIGLVTHARSSIVWSIGCRVISSLIYFNKSSSVSVSPDLPFCCSNQKCARLMTIQLHVTSAHVQILITTLLLLSIYPFGAFFHDFDDSISTETSDILIQIIGLFFYIYVYNQRLQ